MLDMASRMWMYCGGGGRCGSKEKGRAVFIMMVRGGGRVVAGRSGPRNSSGGPGAQRGKELGPDGRYMGLYLALIALGPKRDPAATPAPKWGGWAGCFRRAFAAATKHNSHAYLLAVLYLSEQ